MGSELNLTTTAGAPIADNQNSITAGPLGPVLLQDYQLLEKLAHQNRERIPECTVHAKGWGAYGTLTITQHASLLRARSLQVPRLHSYAEAASEDQYALADRDVGFLVVITGELASGPS